MPSRPDRYAVIGNPVAHSRSPAIHAMFAAQTGQRIEYTRLLAPLDGFAAAVDAFRADGGRGLNVTLPFKLQAFAYAGTHSARATVAGAVNTLVFDGAQAHGEPLRLAARRPRNSRLLHAPSTAPPCPAREPHDTSAA